MAHIGSFFDIKHQDHRVVLLYRFHITVIAVNMLAIGIDLFSGRYYNGAIEAAAIVLLVLNLLHLRAKGHPVQSAYGFLAILSAALLALIYINHFATMSVVFVLLLPLTTLLFIRLKQTLAVVAVLCAAIAGLLYIEHLGNPANPLVNNPQALFNLAYAAVIIYIFGLLYHFYILKTYDELDASDRQKGMLLSEVHHRVKNNLNVIASIIGLQANRQEEAAREELLKSKARIESIAMVHEMLYECENFEKIDFEGYMKRLSHLLLGMYDRNRNVEVRIEGSGAKLPLDLMVQLGIMVHEMVTNSIKYAFDGSKGVIRIGLQTNGTGYRFSYSDDGKGVEETEKLLKSRSLGVKLIHLAAKQLRGSLRVERDAGLTYIVEFEDA